MAITNGYCSLAELKAALRIPSADTIDDALLELAVESASREIDAATERQFFSTSATRIYTPRDSYITETDDIITLTTLRVSGAANGIYDTTWKTSDYQLEPLNGLAGGVPVPFSFIRAVGDFTFPTSGGEATVQIVGVFGFSSVPIAVKQATIILASRIFKRLDSPLGVAGFGDIGVMRVGKLDPDVEALIMPYKKVRFA